MYEVEVNFRSTRSMKLVSISRDETGSVSGSCNSSNISINTLSGFNVAVENMSLPKI